MTATARQSRQGSGGDWRVARQSRAVGGGPVVGLVRQSSRARAGQQSTSTSRVPLGNEAEHEQGTARAAEHEQPVVGLVRQSSRARAGQWRDRQTGEAEEGREGKGKRERGESPLERGLPADDDGYGGTAADDDGTAGKRRMASPTPNALQPCRIENEREVGEGSGAAVRRCRNEMGAVGAAASGWARATADEGQRGIVCGFRAYSGSGSYQPEPGSIYM
ncbi:hypothetical protein ACLOJK_007658 [Asimina triloba]